MSTNVAAARNVRLISVVTWMLLLVGSPMVAKSKEMRQTLAMIYKPLLPLTPLEATRETTSTHKVAATNGADWTDAKARD